MSRSSAVARCRSCGYAWIPRRLGDPGRCPNRDCRARWPTLRRLVAECQACGATWRARKRKIQRCEDCRAPKPKVKFES